MYGTVPVRTRVHENSSTWGGGQGTTRTHRSHELLDSLITQPPKSVSACFRIAGRSRTRSSIRKYPFLWRGMAVILIFSVLELQATEHMYEARIPIHLAPYMAQDTCTLQLDGRTSESDTSRFVLWRVSNDDASHTQSAHHVLAPGPQQLLLKGLRQGSLVNDVLAGHPVATPLQIEPVRGVTS